MKKITPKVKNETKNKQDSVGEPELSPSPIEVILKKYNDDIKRHMSALSEDFQGQVAMIAEQVVGTTDKVEGLTNKVGGLTDTVARLTDRVDVLTDTVAMQGTKLDEVIHVQKTHTEMIGTIMEDVSEIKIELKNKADKAEVVRLERRVQSLV